jgi:catechol 2,3-dioxygenase-like lactoylglutathione lyase family enzyme
MSDQALQIDRQNDEVPTSSPVKINKIGHLVYEVSDVDRTVAFWTDIMNFKVSDRTASGMVFLRCGKDHHAIAVRPGKASQRPDAGLQVEHLAFEVDDVDMLLRAQKYMEAKGVEIASSGRKGAGSSYSLYFRDPDGYLFELYSDLDQIDETGRTRPAEQFKWANSLEEAIANPLPKNW